ncbi:probable glutamate receptor [Macrobrachium nipponense]|uniref:probable glutamate receptor n=1 Tax=Macrobrachium nipponense TaxID=159736 RepID=UPI0030C83022
MKSSKQLHLTTISRGWRVRWKKMNKNGGRTNVGNDPSDVIEEVLTASFGSRQCSLVLVTDGSSSTASMDSVIKNFGVQGGIGGVFEVIWDTADDNLTMADNPWMIQQMQMIKKTSRCQTVILVSEEGELLKVLLRQIHENELLVWPTKLIAVTHAQVSLFSPVRKEILSVTNSVLVTLEGKPELKRCKLLLLPSWTTRGLQLNSHLPLLPNKFMKLIDGGQLRVASENYPPHVTLEEMQVSDDSGAKRLSYTGPMLILFDLLASRINFTYSLVRPPDRSWGIRRPDGSWTGMVGMIRRKEVDMAIGPFGITYIRAQVLDYTRSMFVDYVRVLAKRGRSEVDPWGFAMPLAPVVWGSTFGTLVVFLVVSAVMYFTALERTGSFGQTVLLWVILTFVVVRCYSGNLMSLLAVRYISQPFQTLRRVEQDPRITMVWEADTAFIQTLKSAQSGIFHDVAEKESVGRFKVISSVDYSSTIENDVMRGDHVLIVEDLSCKMLLADHFTKTGTCEFYLSKEMFLPLTFAMVMQKHSPLGLAVNERDPRDATRKRPQRENIRG